MSIPRRLAALDSVDAVQEILKWVDSVPLSRPKRNIARDFSDGVLVAEIVAFYHPSFVEMHNYPPSSSLAQKLFNWNTLNNKVFKKLGFGLNVQDMEDCANVVNGSIEKVLAKLRAHIQKVPPRSSRPGSGRPQTVERTKPSQPYSAEELSRLLHEQDAAMSELRKTVEILTQKNVKLEQLIEIKEKKIEALVTKLNAGTTNGI